MNILVIAPHPDDEVLGCGGTIAKYSRASHRVYLCIVTCAYTPDWTKEFIRDRPKQVKEANDILGIKKTYFLNFPTVKLDTIPRKELNNAIYRIVETVEPDILFIPHRGDLNLDHRLVFEAALVALRPTDCIIKKVLSYETTETDWGRQIEPFRPNVYEDIGDTFKKKIEAMKVYKSELRQYPHPRSLEGIKVLAKKRGIESGLKMAEAFMLIREVSD